MANAVKSPCGFCGVGLDAAAPTKTILSSKLHSICADNYTSSINAHPSFMNAPRDAKNVVLANLQHVPGNTKASTEGKYINWFRKAITQANDVDFKRFMMDANGISSQNQNLKFTFSETHKAASDETPFLTEPRRATISFDPKAFESDAPKKESEAFQLFSDALLGRPLLDF